MEVDAQPLDHRVVFHRQFEQHGAIIVGVKLSIVGVKLSSTRRRRGTKVRGEKRVFSAGLRPSVSPRQTFSRLPRVSMLDLRIGDELSFGTHAALLLQIDILDTILQREGPVGLLILALLLVLSVYSWTVIFSKLGVLRGARSVNARFLRSFRKAPNLQGAVVATEQFRPSPLVTVFDFGYEEVERQAK